jgi:hypothetical protein
MSDHSVRMTYTDSGQAQPSNWEEESLGAVGQYGLVIEWTRQGMATQRVYTFESSSPMRRDFLALAVAIEGTR